MAEIYRMMEPWTDETFWDFSKVIPQPNTIYVIGRQHFIDDMVRIRQLCETGQYTIVFDNSAEGSWTLEAQLRKLKLWELVTNKKLLVIGGADMASCDTCLVHEHLLTSIMDYDETFLAQKSTEEIFRKKSKPYSFLFLNGRARPHRKYLYERLRRLGLLDRTLYTMLHAIPDISRRFTLCDNDVDIMATPTELRRLPDEYEVERYRKPEFGPIVPDQTFLKQELFRREWGDIYLYHRPYVDTYFSLVTETICAESDISFRTEKIAKPLAMGHPFVIAANRGYYCDLRNLGFQTFDHVIDESFDEIDDAQDRMDRLIQILQDLCKQDLDSFIDQCKARCKYNQQRLAEFTQEHRQAFPTRFFQFIQDHARS